MDELRKLVPGVEIAEGLEPSINLIEKFHTMYETGNLRHLAWEELTHRDQEIKGIKKEEFLQIDKASGLLRQALRSAEGSADLRSDLLLVHALTRRGVAMHVARLFNFKVHSRYVDMLIREYMRPPLAAHAPVSLQQLLQADQEVFCRAAQLTRGDLATTTSGDFKLDDVIPKVMQEYRVQALLFQMRAPTSSGGGGRGLKRQLDADNATDTSGFAAQILSNSRKRQKGQQKNNKAKQGRPSLPDELLKLGCKPSSGRKFCYNFNMEKGCRDGNGKNCDRGDHACMKCGGSHSAASRKCR